MELLAGHQGVDRELTPKRRTVGGIALAEYVVAIAGGGVRVVAGINDHEAAVGQTEHGWFVLFRDRRGVDPELGTSCFAVGVIALGEDPAATAVLTTA